MARRRRTIHFIKFAGRPRWVEPEAEVPIFQRSCVNFLGFYERQGRRVSDPPRKPPPPLTYCMFAHLDVLDTSSKQIPLNFISWQ
jgi:hypothetical protein